MPPVEFQPEQLRSAMLIAVVGLVFLLAFVVLCIPSWILDRKGYSGGKSLAAFLASTFLGLWIVMLIVALVVDDAKGTRKKRAA